MKRLKVHIYPQGTRLIQDRAPIDILTYHIPLQRQGILEQCDVVLPEQAEIFICGQIAPADSSVWLPTPVDFKYYVKRHDRHVMDVDGDFQVYHIPAWLCGSIITTAGAHVDWKNRNMFVRPLVSTLLNDMLGSVKVFPPPKSMSFGFRGQRISRPVRANMVTGFARTGLPGVVEFSPGWGQWNAADNVERRIYEEILKTNILGLCPRGEGMSSSRYYETCFYGRVPVMIGDNLLMGYDWYDTSFAFYLPEDLTPTDFEREFEKIAQTPLPELQDRARAARAYFDAVVRPYFADPTLEFIKFLERKGLRDV